MPACAQMALAQLGIVTTQAQLAQILGTRVGVGTPFSRVERLAQWGVRVRLTRRVSAGIAAVGTRPYYLERGFERVELYVVGEV